MGSSNSSQSKKTKPRRPQKSGPPRKKNQPINETTFNKRIRENLIEATAKDNIAELQTQMDTFERNNLEDAGDYRRAAEKMEFLKMRKDIRDACLRRNVSVLQDSIRKVQASKHKNKLKPYLDRANFIRQELGNSTSFKHEIPGIHQSTISEIRSYNRPPPGVHETMIATYLILGYTEEHLTDWAEITGLMGRTGEHYLLRELSLAEGKKLDKDTATKASTYLATHPLEVVRQTSNGAAAFYVWAFQKVGVKKAKGTEMTKTLKNSGGKGPQLHQTVMHTTPKDGKDNSNRQTPAKQQRATHQLVNNKSPANDNKRRQSEAKNVRQPAGKTSSTRK